MNCRNCGHSSGAHQGNGCTAEFGHCDCPAWEEDAAEGDEMREPRIVTYQDDPHDD